SFLRKGRVVFDQQRRQPARVSAAMALNGALQPAAAVLCTDPEPHRGLGVPVLRVPNVRQAVLDLGVLARARFAGRAIGVMGPAKDTVTAMLAHALGAWGEVGLPEGNVSLPPGIAWNMTCMPRQAAYWLFEMA